jgi:hypothetical protein
VATLVGLNAGSESGSPRQQVAGAAVVSCNLSITDDGTANALRLTQMRRTPAGDIIGGKGYVSYPYNTARAIKTCSGGNPLEVSWIGHSGTSPVTEAWFLNTSNVEITTYDFEPLGMRVFRGVATDPAIVADSVSFNEVRIDFRSESSLRPYRSESVPGYTRYQLGAIRYAHTLDKSVPYGGAQAIVQWRCNTAAWNNLVSLTTDSQGHTDWLYVPTDDEIRCPGTSQTTSYRAVLLDATYIWGDVLTRFS